MKRTVPKKRERNDPALIQGLLDKAREGDAASRETLVRFFDPLARSLVGVCMTSRINYRSRSQIAFLKLFGSVGTPIENIACRLKKETAHIPKDEMLQIATLAIYEAIVKCRENLSATIVYCFKDLIFEAIREGNKPVLQHIDTIEDSVPCFQDESILRVFVSTLPEHLQDIYRKIQDGEKVEVTEEFREAFRHFLD